MYQILMADDDQYTRKLLQAALESEDDTLATAGGRNSREWPVRHLCLAAGL